MEPGEINIIQKVVNCLLYIQLCPSDMNKQLFYNHMTQQGNNEGHT
jgi:hypothetical protein